jgi:anti-anti-sigma factor
MQEPLARTTVVVLGEHTTVEIAGEIDLSNVETIEKQVRDAFVEDHRLTVDVSRLVYIDSAGLNMLYRLVSSLGAPGEVAVLAPEGCRARRVIELAGMHDLLNVVSLKTDGDSTET